MQPQIRRRGEIPLFCHVNDNGRRSNSSWLLEIDQSCRLGETHIEEIGRSLASVFKSDHRSTQLRRGHVEDKAVLHIKGITEDERGRRRWKDPSYARARKSTEINTKTQGSRIGWGMRGAVCTSMCIKGAWSFSIIVIITNAYATCLEQGPWWRKRMNASCQSTF